MFDVQVGLSKHYPVFFGRRDSLNASVAEANKNLPSPFSVYAELKQNFSFQGLDEKDLIALSGVPLYLSFLWIFVLIYHMWI
jgi:hypothetical protein